MSQLNSPSCYKFYRLVNDEIASGQFMHDSLTKQALQNQFITPQAKQHYGIPESLPLTMYDFTRSSLDVLPKLRFSHLMTLLEAFVKEYIAEKDGVAVEAVSSHIGAEKSSWSKTEKDSTSLYDLRFVNYVLGSRYGIDLTSHIQPVMFEVGAFRRCLVHHQGVIIDDYFRRRLKSTISKLGVDDIVGSVVTVTHKLMAIYIEDFRAIMRACDYTR